MAGSSADSACIPLLLFPWQHIHPHLETSLLDTEGFVLPLRLPSVTVCVNLVVLYSIPSSTELTLQQDLSSLCAKRPAAKQHAHTRVQPHVCAPHSEEINLHVYHKARDPIVPGGDLGKVSAVN